MGIHSVLPHESSIQEGVGFPLIHELRRSVDLSRRDSKACFQKGSITRSILLPRA